MKDMKFCKDCKWHKWYWYLLEEPICINPKISNRNEVNGEPIFKECIVQRIDFEGECGKEAKYFEARN